MAGATVSTSSVTAATDSKKSYLLPFILVTSLFFLWGLAYGLLDVLNKHFQEVLNITKTRSTLLQLAYFGAYFLMALPAGIFMNKYGYKRGIILGLLLYAIGAFLFYPAASTRVYGFFLFALFIIASGCGMLETAANPYINNLGDPEGAAWRINFAQSFNGLAAALAPRIGGVFILSGITLTETQKAAMSTQQFNDYLQGESNAVKIPYIIIGLAVLSI